MCEVQYFGWWALGVARLIHSVCLCVCVYLCLCVRLCVSVCLLVLCVTVSLTDDTY